MATKFPDLEKATVFYEEASECCRQLDQAKQQLTKLDEMMIMEDKSDCKGADSLADPHLSVPKAREPFEFLLDKNAEAGGKLEKVVFYSGSWERPWDGPMFLYDDWMDDHRSWAVCEVIDGSGVPVEGVERIAKVEVGDRLLLCQDEWRKQHKVVSEVKGRGKGWKNEWLDEENQEILQRALDMELS